MKTLWFRQVYVPQIIAGTKTHTARRPSSRLPRAGEIVALSVGPRPPFARARVTSVETREWDELSPAKRSELQALGIDSGPICWIEFVVLPA